LPSKNIRIEIYKAVIFPVFLWAQNLAAHFKERTQTEVFQHRVIRKIFPLRGRKLRNEGFHISFFSPGVVSVMKTRRVKWAGLVTSVGWKRNGYRGLVGKFEGKSTFERTRHTGQHNIKMDL
jgi:hypothetical protein